MSYQLYRNTTLGTSLQDSIDDMVQQGHITPQLAMKVMLQFDKAINSALATKVRNRIQFKGHLSTYRFCDNVWTLVMDHSEYRIDVNDSLKCDNVKIVACDGRGATGQHD